MTLFAVAMPLVPGKTEEWRAWLKEVLGARKAEFVASRRAVGARERTFLQSTPMGDMVIVTLEADDPASAFARMVAADDDFSHWFMAKVAEFHGVDLTQGLPPNMSTLVIDSEA